MIQNFKTNFIHRCLGIVGAALLVLLDQATKHLAVLRLKYAPPIPLIPGVFELSYLENHGAAFGILQGQKLFLLVMTAVALLVLSYLYFNIPGGRHFFYMRIALLLLIAGAVGNFIDRIVHDYVIDFFYFRLIDFPVFNVADIYVTVSFFLLILLFCFYYKEEDFDYLTERLFFWKKKDGQ